MLPQVEPGEFFPDHQQSIVNPPIAILRWRVVHISKPSENSTSADWEEPTMVEQSVLANSSKFIEGSFEEEQTEQADQMNSSSAIQDQWEAATATVGDFSNGFTLTKKPDVVEPIVVEQSVLADSSTFIEITEEKAEQEKDGSLSFEVEAKEEEELPEDIISD